ncbi:phosphate ABC transporter substrate-binding protein PstS [Streptomyces antibioticus]|uniref:Phosphate-binding protein n=1 Tax=Streptomyces antibioticus TaxID=1890 RepID=A0AAE6Y970_STRAT|nr:phosphate ABC transporter substrate-binding protein PstS [Streptomyces antibioticus]MCX4738231.1 phosphate ABC transporter substrate-binding protein PstS [Streptomyces antibioticus]MCX5169985.1 phosphate ABC transporter substrate-binding protein PstS [Streptomyces antibioticus]OOQ51182.1 phosphate-binding protein [Streptomyces antibioticus]QIT45343.1 phosphate ABC transporter substrate-binding protein PstS [Streptomyces antibioticus]
MKLQRMNRRALTLGALAVSGALALTACGSDDTGAAGDSGTSASATAAAGDIKCDDAKGQLLADGSSAQKNAIDAWVKNFTQACNGVQVNYKGSGSGAGVTAFTQGTVAFAGSDSALKPEEVAASKKVCTDGQGIDLPMVAGPIAVAYNVSGVDDLVLDAPTIAKIFDGKITNWNDAAIAKLNPDAKLPDLKIQPYHRSDESGTTDNFTKYLIAATPDNWKYEGGKAWQAKGGQSAAGSSGVAQGVKQTNGAIGYMELSYAKDGLGTVAIDTGAAAPVKASSDGATKAVAAAQVVGTGNDLSLKLDYTTKAEGAYPITLVTYEIACDKGNKAETLPATKAFLRYIASEQGQGILSGIDYAPIPDAIISKVRTTVEGLS